jgi:hypothetical protein
MIFDWHGVLALRDDFFYTMEFSPQEGMDGSCRGVKGVLKGDGRRF